MKKYCNSKGRQITSKVTNNGSALQFEVKEFILPKGSVKLSKCYMFSLFSKITMIRLQTYNNSYESFQTLKHNTLKHTNYSIAYLGLL